MHIKYILKSKKWKSPNPKVLDNLDMLLLKTCHVAKLSTLFFHSSLPDQSGQRGCEMQKISSGVNA